ncbi:MAG TPA: hypothetical protein VGW31_03635, partial [Hanamia sp.]|nr:hypothetical protein [Hanamia sp.]
IVFVSIFPLKRDIEEYQVQKNGETIKATITYLKDCIGSKTYYFMKFAYNGQEYDKRVRCGFENTHKVGETISMKHESGTDIFLFENEKKEKEFVSSSLLGLLGIFLIGIGIKKRNSERSN